MAVSARPNGQYAMKLSRGYQKGVMLLEALIGLLIFSIGILALIAMQSVAISQVTDAQYRVEANALAERMLGNLFVLGGLNPAPTQASAVIAAWATEVTNSLPSGVGTVTPGVNGQVTVTVTWKAPAASTTSNHTVVGVIANNP